MEISLRQVTYFLRLVDRGSFTAAAAALGITQPALSLAISQLEKTLGVRLVERGVPARLTDSGQAFHRYALRIHRDVREARDELAALNSGLLGRLDVCVGPSAAGAEVATVLGAMAEEFPSLEIHVQPGALGAIAERIHSNEFPVYVGTMGAEDHDPSLHAVPLATLPLAVIGGASHPLARATGAAVADLLAWPWLAMGDLDANLPGWAEAFTRVGLEPPRPVIDVRNLALARSLLTHGRFLTILPLSIVGPDVEVRLLARIAWPAVQWRLPLYAVSRAGSTLPAAARIFVERLTRAFEP